MLDPGAPWVGRPCGRQLNGKGVPGLTEPGAVWADLRKRMPVAVRRINRDLGGTSGQQND